MGSARIDGYMQEITPDLYGAFWMRRRIVEELKDHLLETTDRFHKQGMSRAEAEERAIQQFGSPRLVARTFAQSKGVGVPTTFTRYSGLVGPLGAVLLMIANIGQEISESFSHGAFAEVAVTGATLVGIMLVGIYVRSRGQLGMWGGVGFRLIFSGLVIGFGSGALWFGPGAILGFIIMLVGRAIYLSALIKSDVLPRPPLVMILVGVGSTLLIGAIGTFVGFDSGAWGLVIQEVTTIVGLSWIGRFMWSQQPVDRTEWSDPAQTA